MTIGRQITNKELFFQLCTQPRSQAIHGSLVETLGPYPQYYTRIIFNFYKDIVTPKITSVNTTLIFFSKEKLMFDIRMKRNNILIFSEEIEVKKVLVTKIPYLIIYYE